MYRFYILDCTYSKDINNLSDMHLQLLYINMHDTENEFLYNSDKC